MNKLIKRGIITVTGASALAFLVLNSATKGTININDNLVFAAENDEAEITKDSESNTSESEDKIYGIGSVSKMYVTTAVLQLVDQGKVDLDAPVTDYIDDFKMADERYKDITVRMLMNHTSGIYGTSARNIFLLGDNDFVATDSVLENLKTQKLKADPGEYAAYCNDGFELLEIIVERVSGMSYTDYLEKNIAAKIGAENIYTGENVFGNEALADIYPDGKNRYDTEFCMGFGTGGTFSTAVDTCEFGSTFFKGDNRLLSESSKDAMSEYWYDDMGVTKYDTSCLDQCGLGWDLVSIPMYEESGVKAVFKGGDCMQYHAALLVMPEEEISVCVTSAEGSSGYNLAMSEALANIVLEEKGIEIEETTAPEVTLQDTVPDSYKQYEGLYTLNGIPAMVSFPDMKYMQVDMFGNGTETTYYMYSDRGFVKATGDVEGGNGRVDKDYSAVDIKEVDGHIYVTQELIEKNTGLIGAYQKTYIGEMMDINPVSEEALKVWQERDGEKYEIISEKYSSEQYTTPFGQFAALDDTGYVIDMVESRIYRIIDENHLEGFSTMPSSANRDYRDISVDENGVIHSSVGIDVMPVSSNESFNGDVKEVSLTTDSAKWYNIDDSMANKTISLDRPENSAVFVYDKYGKVKYSTHMVDYGNIICLPKGGSIVFIGETGDTIKITE